MSMIIATVVLLTGFVLLTTGANFLIDASATVAKKFGVSTLLIGLTILALGTSLPELAVAISASISGQLTLSVGEALGSNIANIGLVLGITALIKPLWIRSGILKKELPLLFTVTLLAGLMLFKHRLVQTDGMLLLLGAAAIIAWFIWQAKTTKPSQEELTIEYQKEMRERDITKTTSYFKDIAQMIGGIILLPLGAYMIVNSSTYIAATFHISNFVIGLTVIAIGTSLPELATSLIGIQKDEDDLVVGNIIGSNILNILAILAIPAITTHTLSLQKYVFYRDFSAMMIMTILLYLFAFVSVRRKRKLIRWEAAVLIVAYLTYLAIPFLLK